MPNKTENCYPTSPACGKYVGLPLYKHVAGLNEKWRSMWTPLEV